MCSSIYCYTRTSEQAIHQDLHTIVSLGQYVSGSMQFGCCCGLSVIVYTGYLFAISWRRSYPARNASPCKVSKNRKAYFIFCVFCLQRNMYSNLACILFGLLRHAQYTAQNLHGDPHEQVLDNIM